MIIIEKRQEGTDLFLKVEGRLDTLTTPELEKALGDYSAVRKLYFDFEKLEYISSAGLRLLLSTQKQMKTQGKMVIQNINSDVERLLKMTGFISLLNIE